MVVAAGGRCRCRPSSEIVVAAENTGFRNNLAMCDDTFRRNFGVKGCVLTVSGFWTTSAVFVRRSRGSRRSTQLGLESFEIDAISKGRSTMTETRTAAGRHSGRHPTAHRRVGRACWHDPSRSATERATTCSAEMTLEEKVGQLGSRWAGNDMTAEATAPHRRRRREPTTATSTRSQRRADAGRLRRLGHASPWRTPAAHGLGHLTRVYGSVPITAAGGAAEVISQQRVVHRELPAGHPGASSTRSA